MTNPSAEFTIRATDSTRPAFQRSRANLRGMRNDLNGMSGMMLRNRRIVQQAGFQLSDFAVQVAGGQSAILAVTQQLPQFVQGFGAVGAVLAALITVVGTATLMITRAGGAMADLTPIVGVLKDEFEDLARILSAVGTFFIEFANIVVNNLDRMLVIGLTVAAFFAGRLVFSFLAAQLAGFTLAGAVASVTGALVTLRAAFLTFLPIAVLVIIGNLVFKFLELTKAAGGFGAVLGLVRDVFVEVFTKIGDMTDSFTALWKGFTTTLLVGWDKTVVDMLVIWRNFILNLADGLRSIKLDGLADDLDNAAIRVGSTILEKQAKIKESARSAGESFKLAAELFVAADKPLDSVAKLLELINNEGDRIDIRDWFKGADEIDKAKKAIKDTTKELKTLTSEVQGATRTAFDGLWASIAEGGKGALDVLDSLRKSLATLAIKAAGSQFLSRAFPTLFGGAGFTPLVNKDGTTKFAKGGVVNTPTNFTMSNGRTGQAGEAGPEAILPLRRASDGTLGVTAGRGGGGSGVSVTTNIINQAPNTRVTERQSTQQNGNILREFVIEEVNRAVMSGRTDGANKSRFGTQPTRKVR